MNRYAYKENFSKPTFGPKNQTPISIDDIVSYFEQTPQINFEEIKDFPQFLGELQEKSKEFFQIPPSLNLKNIRNFKDYLTKYTSSLNSFQTLTNFGLEQITNVALFWTTECKPCKFSAEEIVIISITKILLIKCSVLYKSAIAPESQNDITLTQITINNYGGFSELSFRR